MLYSVLRAMSGLALRWFYRDVAVAGVEHIPREGPLLVAVNHQNALVDALIAGWLLPRRVTLTAKATIFANPVAAFVFRRVGILPLRRAVDEAKRGAPVSGLTRNAASFAAVTATLAQGGAVLIFPEGKSHSEPALAPLRSGLARMALDARDRAGVRGLTIVPIGLTFEAKGRPRSRVYAQVGEPLALDGWAPPAGVDPVPALTRAVEERLRGVTVNYASPEELARVMEVARLLADVFAPDRPLGEAETPLADTLRVVARLEAARQAPAMDPAREAQIGAFLARLDAFRDRLTALGVATRDAIIGTGTTQGAGFALREGALLLVSLPLAILGTVAHRLPLRLAWRVGRRTSRNADEPAMHTIVAGAALVLLAYAVELGLVAWFAGGWWALALAIALPISATADLRLRDRIARARRRAHAYTLFRREPATREALVEDVEWLRREAAALERTAGAEAPVSGVPDPGESVRSDPSARRPV